jgi:hypothetical protein
VITSRPLRPIRVGRARIRFLVKKHLAKTPVSDVKTYTGTMRVSTPEATALDLVRYVDSVGHLGNVATVLTELAESMTGTRLLRAARASTELSNVQRVGFLLDLVGAESVTSPLAGWLESQHTNLVALRPGISAKDSKRNERWQVLVNENVEADK